MNYQFFLLLALLICILIICFVLPKITSQYISIYTFFVSIICIIVMIVSENKVNASVPTITADYIVDIQNTNINKHGTNITYINDRNEKISIFINEIKYDSDKTYIEKQNKKWGFLYKTDYILHIKK